MMELGDNPEDGWGVDWGRRDAKPCVVIARFKKGRRVAARWMNPDEAYEFARRIMSAADHARNFATSEKDGAA